MQINHERSVPKISISVDQFWEKTSLKQALSEDFGHWCRLM